MSGRINEIAKDRAAMQKIAEERLQELRQSVDPTRKPQVERRVQQMPVSSVKRYLRAINGKASPKGAIAAHCMECMGWDREAVKGCTGLACPLWAYRPFRK